MYSPARVADRLARMRPLIAKTFPGETTLPAYSTADILALTADLLATRDEDGTTIRSLTADESRFAAAEQLRVAADARHALKHYWWIDEEGHGLRRLYPLWESQTFVLDRLAALEDEHHKSQSGDGLLVNVLKIRQVGISTLGAGGIVTHRVVTQPHIRAVVGSDTEEQAGYLFQMVHRAWEHLPWFLRPTRGGYNQNRFFWLTNQSRVKTAWGKSTRGALQEVGGRKGNIERGRTNSVVHISELATWDNPDQLDTALLPGIPRSPYSFCMFESTAELADDWWHHQWLVGKKGTGRFRNIFIPWYAVPSKYTIRPPDGWEPKPSTLAMEAKVVRDSPEWFSGRTIHPSPAQLYWYESTRAFYEEKGKLGEFLKEYPSDDEECFRYAGGTVFTLEQLARIDQQARPLIDLWTVQPAREIAALRRLPEEQEAISRDRRPTPPVSASLPPRIADAYPVPPGFGFHRLSKPEIRERLDATDEIHQRFDGLLQLFEYPRHRGPRRYIIGGDVADGIGGDYTVFVVTREGTLEEPPEDVAVWLSNHFSTQQAAGVLDALGRFYTDEDGREALVALETNNHGLAVQDLLQLHFGYTNFYVWEYYNAATPEKRYSQRIGWSTTPSTRPLLLSYFHGSITAADPVTTMPDYRINSAVIRQELRHFITLTHLAEAEHAPGQHDDGIFACAISAYVAYRLAGGEAEPLSERRRRKAALDLYHARLGAEVTRRDWRNTDADAQQAQEGTDDDSDSIPDERGTITFFDEDYA